jgi:hypothetical protein
MNGARRGRRRQPILLVFGPPLRLIIAIHREISTKLADIWPGSGFSRSTLLLIYPTYGYSGIRQYLHSRATYKARVQRAPMVRAFHLLATTERYGHASNSFSLAVVLEPSLLKAESVILLVDWWQWSISAWRVA